MAEPVAPIRLGLLAPLTGLVSLYGEEIATIGRLARDEVNATGGLLGRPLELVVVDDGSIPERAVPAAEHLVEACGCTALIGNLLSNSRIAVASRVAEPRRIPYLNFSFYEGSISGRYFFNFAALPNQQIERMVPYFAARFGPKMFFAGSNYEWPLGSIDAAKRSLAQLGGDVVGEEYLPIGSEDTGELLERVARSGADVFVPYFAGSDQIRLLTRFTESGLKSRMAVVMGHFDEAMASHLPPAVRAGMYSVNTYFMPVDTPENHEVLARLARQPGVTGLWPAGNGVMTNFSEGVCLCVRAFAAAVRRAGSGDREAVVDALETIAVRSPQGLVTMDPATHHAAVNIYLARCGEDGAFSVIEEFGCIPPVIPERYRRPRPGAVPHPLSPGTPPPAEDGSGVAVVDRDGRILHVTQALLDLWGYSAPQDLIDRDAASLWADPGQWQAALAATAPGRNRRVVLSARTAAGEQRPAEVVLEPASHGLTTLLCRPPPSTAPRDPGSTAARILQVTDIAVIACDRNGLITQANHHACALFGYPLAELIGMTVHELVPPRFRQRHHEHLQEFVDGPRAAVPMGRRGQVSGYRRDGSEFPAEASISKFLEDGEWVLVVSLRDVSDLQQANAELLWQASHDPLTELPNRALIRDRLHNALERNRRQSAVVALLFIDLDGFKLINDTHGHAAGDALLVEASRRLLDTVRPGDTVARLGGDEFVVLCEQLPALDDLGALADRINRVLRQPFTVAGQAVYVTASIGVALGRGDSHGADELLRDADAAMYQVKERGRDGWQVFSSDLHTRAHRRLALTTGLRTASEDDSLGMQLQPIVGAMDGAVLGAEVLLRWSLDGHPVTPGEFIPVAEATGSILAIGEWVFTQACRVGAHLGARYGADAPYLSVNLSSRQLQDRHLAERFAAILARSGADPLRITLELTETALMGDGPNAVETLHRLAGLGLSLAVDDFGTGYSSLSQLLRLPVSTLKVDREFVDGIQTNTEHYAIVDAVIRMARVLGLQVVAEGVENQGQALLLREMGSGFLQGYHFHRPLAEADFLALLEHRHAQAPAPPQEIHYTIYASTASHPLSRRELVRILHTARSRNAELGITGCLLYLNGAFLQMLEGPADAVTAVMEAIRRDSRHQDLREVAAGRERSRLFRGWRMGFFDLEAMALPEGLRPPGPGPQALAQIAADPWLCYSLMRLISLGVDEDQTSPLRRPD